MRGESAGLLLFRRRERGIEVLLAHPGGPFWAKKDLGAWTLPKGEIEEGEDPLEAARREFFEETGLAPEGPFIPLGAARQKAGKLVHAWAFQGDCDPKTLRSNTCAIEWPPRSGKTVEIPEVDRFEFFPLGEAAERINPAQRTLLDALRSRAAP